MANSLYTPFLTQAGQAIGRGLEKRGLRQQEKEKNKLIQSAYMGQPGALEQLYGVDPQAASNIESQKTQREQSKLKTQQSEEDRKRKILLENKELVDESLKEAAKLETVEDANTYIMSVVEANKELFQGIEITPMTEDRFNQIKSAYGDKSDEKPSVQSSRFLDGGGVQITYKDGTVELVEPTEEEAAIVKRAEDRGIEIQQERSKGREIGKETGKIASKALDSTEKLRSNNSKLSQVITEVQGGADTGPLAKRLPSFRASTLRLKAIQNELGLDVIGSVTFGALSEGELAVAMDTALPTALEGQDLIDWAQNKIDAQEKLARYLEDQAIFLSKDGNTPIKWLEKGRNERAAREANEAKKQDQDGDLTPEEQTELEQLRQRFGQ